MQKAPLLLAALLGLVSFAGCRSGGQTVSLAPPPADCHFVVERQCFSTKAAACEAAKCEEQCKVDGSRIRCVPNPPPPELRPDAPPAAPGDVEIVVLQHVVHCGGAAPEPGETDPIRVGGPIDVAPGRLDGNRLVLDKQRAVATDARARIELPDAEVWGILYQGRWHLAELIDGQLHASIPGEPCSWDGPSPPS